MRTVMRLMLGLGIGLWSLGGGAQEVTYYHTDALGSVVAITDAAGQVVESNEYEPYGEDLTGAKDGPAYTGHVSDAVTGMSYMQQRYYDPQIGRFLSVDPVSASDTGSNFNRYRYAANNPYRFVDPDGRKDWDSLSAYASNAMSAGYGLGFGPPTVTGFDPIFGFRNYDVKPDVKNIDGELERKVSKTADRYYGKTGKRLLVTDGPRTARDQAKRMRYKIEAGEGVRLYRDRRSANEILDAYERAPEDPISEMERVINEQMARGVFISKHLQNNAVDFRVRGVDEDELRDSIGDATLLKEGKPPHYHVEY